MRYPIHLHLAGLLVVTGPLLVLEQRPAKAGPGSCSQIWVYTNEYINEASEVTKRFNPKIYKMLGFDGFLVDEVLGSLKKASKILTKAQWTMPSCFLFLNMNKFPSCHSSSITSAFSVMGLIRRELFIPIDDLIKEKDDKVRVAKINDLHARMDGITNEVNRLVKRSDQLVRSCN
jgi:hypothetical protein